MKITKSLLELFEGTCFWSRFYLFLHVDDTVEFTFFLSVSLCSLFLPRADEVLAAVWESRGYINVS